VNGRRARRRVGFTANPRPRAPEDNNHDPDSNPTTAALAARDTFATPEPTAGPPRRREGPVTAPAKRSAAADPARLDWASILARAAEIVERYDTGVTLRQLFYRLVAAGLISNTLAAYKGLSRTSAEARRGGTFPRLIDRTRQIHRALRYTSPADALGILADEYRRDRTDGQDVSLYLGVEKAGIVEQLMAWFGDPLGIPVLALGGYAGQSYVDDIVDDVATEDRPAHLLFAGDWDPSGEDIDRDFLVRADCWAKVIRIALTVEQVAEYQLPELPGKETDSRAAGFIARHGRLAQVELDALDPTILRSLFQAAIDQVWDMSRFLGVEAQEARDRERLRRLARRWS
jgi:hypothetical protein